MPTTPAPNLTQGDGAQLPTGPARPSVDFMAEVRKAFDAADPSGRSEKVDALRRRAFAALDAQGMPGRDASRKLRESWKYTDIQKTLRQGFPFAPEAEHRLVQADLDAFLVPDLDAHLAVVVNGRYVDALSTWGDLPTGVTVEGLQEALKDYPELVEPHLGRYLDVESDPFAALNTAFDLDGLFVHVPKGVTVERPIYVLHVTDVDGPAFVQSRSLIVVEANAEATVFEGQHVTGDAPTFGNHAVEAFVAQNARFKHAVLQMEGEQNRQVRSMQIVQDKDSVASTFTFTLSGGLVRNHLGLLPGAPNCETHLLGLYAATGNEHVDNATSVDHAAPGCMSNELYKGIVRDQALAIFNGRVLVRREGQQTNAYQQSAAVVLSEGARSYAKPELEIYADDVKCSHGSATGSLDDEALFYLRARGIGKQDAEALLLQAFFGEVLTEIPNEPLREHVAALVTKKLSA
jgi:Fe-S cluster assembly protein SufD